MSDTPCEGSIRCLKCDADWRGYATAPSAESLYDTLNRMLWEHLDTGCRPTLIDGQVSP